MDTPLEQLRFMKVWEGEAPFLVWQVQFKTDGNYQKAYLILSAQQGKPDFEIVQNKPALLKPTGTLVTLFRKRSKSPKLSKSGKDETSGNTWLKFETKEGPFFVFLEKGRPSHIHIVDESGTSIARKSSKGTYTKKKQSQIPNFEDLEAFKVKLPLAPSNLDDTPETTEPESTQLIPEHQKRLKGSLKRRLRTVKKSLEKLHKSAITPKALEQTLRKAELLRNFSSMIQPNDSDLTLPPDLTGLEKPITIDLYEGVSPGEQIDKYYSVYKKQKKKMVSDSDQINRTENQIHSIQLTLAEIETRNLSFKECELVQNKFNLKKTALHSAKKGVKGMETLPYKEFASSDGIRLLVGKGSRENDQLTKTAKSNDFWLHSIGVTGSHIIIPKPKGKAPLPTTTIREAAILAIHFSKVRADQQGEVYFTTKAHLKKKKGMPTGLWSVEKSETLFVNYSKKELSDILSNPKSKD